VLQLGVELLRKEVIQPHLPVRLPCSCHSPCRHGARTISSSCIDRRRRTSLSRRTGARRMASEGSLLGKRTSRGTTSLLIARITSYVVTRHAGSRGFVAEFPANSRVSLPPLPVGVATCLRLHPNRRPHLRRLPPNGWATGFGCCRLSWCDGRCVQGPGTYSPRHC
jgi:hypothetical protein